MNGSIILIRSSVGDCYIRYGGRNRVPCPECIHKRLTEAGFTIEFEKEVSSFDIDPIIIQNICREPPFTYAPHTPIAYLHNNEISRHIALPIPGCKRCGPAQRYPHPSEKLFPPDVLTDPLVGITIPSEFLDPEQSQESKTPAFCYSAVGKVTAPHHEQEPIIAHGQGITRKDALTRQLGEAVERYTALRPDVNKLVIASQEELGDSTPSVDLLNRYLPTQITGTRFSVLESTTKLAWILGRSLKYGVERYVPACYVYMTRSWNQDEPPIDRMSSSGLAAHSDPTLVRRSALLELIERFTLTIAWHKQYFGFRVSNGILPSKIAPIIERIRRADLELLLLALTAPPDVPVVMAVLIGDMFPRITIGSAAGLNLGEAALKATLETVSQWQWIAMSPQRLGELSFLDTYSTPLDHVLWYSCSEDNAKSLTRLLLSSETCNSLDQQLVSPNHILEYASQLAPDLIEIDITPADCAWCGFQVRRIIAPGLPLFGFGSLSTPGADLARHGLKDCGLPHPFS